MTMAPAQIQSFITDGFIRIDDAFPSALAAEARAVFWNDLRNRGVRHDGPRKWREPVIRLGMYPQEALVAAANTPRLNAAFDQLVGPGNWRPCRSMGTVPVRFPSMEDAGDTGLHIDASFGDAPDFMEWRANVHSRGLMDTGLGQ